MPKRIIFRANANHKIGAGHVMRVTALAEKLNRDFRCVLIVKDLAESFKEELHLVFEKILYLASEEDLFQIIDAGDIVVLDGYQFDLEYQKEIRSRKCKLVCIDDFATKPYTADLVINHAPGLDPAIFRVDPHTKLCLGPKYSLIRNAFIEKSRTRRKISHLNTAFVCFGGSDYYNLTSRIMHHLLDIDFLKEILVVIGPANLGFDEEKLKADRISVHRNLDAFGMARLMEQSDFAVVPASSILFEVMCVGMPVCSGFYTENQKNIYKGFLGLGVICGLGDFQQNLVFSEVISRYLKSLDLEKLTEKQKNCGFSKSPDRLAQLFKKL